MSGCWGRQTSQFDTALRFWMWGCGRKQLPVAATRPGGKMKRERTENVKDLVRQIRWKEFGGEEELEPGCQVQSQGSGSDGQVPRGT